MARAVTPQRKALNTIIGWTIGVLIFFPIFWIVILSFKSEVDAIRAPLEVLGSDWTTSSYAAVQARSDYFKHFLNSVTIAVGSTLLGLIIAVPAAWAMAFVPRPGTKNVLMWMLSTKMLPPVGVLIPIYLIFRDTGLLDTRTGLVIVLMLINLPIIVWMLYTYFREIPGEIGEFCVFVGPSGCGKSTLLRMIAGLEPITGGEIAIGGEVVNAIPARRARALPWCSSPTRSTRT
jgi:sorbitol/mannitol transport system permease protein